MGLVRDASGRLHIPTPLMAESLMDKSLLAGTETGQVFRPLPDLNVIKLGELMLGDFIPGSDPGLCVCASAQDTVTAEVIEFGRHGQRELLTKAEAQELAAHYGIYLAELGGDGVGIIGGRLRSLSGLQSVESLLAAGVYAFETPEGEPVRSGTVEVERLRPARRGARAVGVVRQEGDLLVPLKLD